MMNYQDELTEISARQLDFVTREDLTPREAVAFLRSGMQLRTFRDILNQVCGRDDLQARLVQGLWEQDRSQQRESVQRKVRNWMAGKSLPTDREDAFRICFALKLELEAAERMLTLLTEQGIHYRNKREVVYAYCLRYGMDYGYANALLQQMFPESQGEEGRRDPVT